MLSLLDSNTCMAAMRNHSLEGAENGGVVFGVAGRDRPSS
jgi:hypothetical protein